MSLLQSRYNELKRTRAEIPGGFKADISTENLGKAGWMDIARWFGRRIGGVIENIQFIDYQELEEIRLRTGRPLLIQTSRRDYFLDLQGNAVQSDQACRIESKDISDALERMTFSSVYAAEQELSQGFLALPGGHRVGVTGETQIENQALKMVKHFSSLNFRVAHEIKGISQAILPYLLGPGKILRHTLLISPPRAGKTTMIRDLTRLISDGVPMLGLIGHTVGVVDERGELAGMRQGESSYYLGMRTDVLDACPKSIGMGMLVRSMAPEVIITDELGSPADIEAVADAIRTGVKILSTAHAGTLDEARERPVLRAILDQGIFERLVILSRRLGPGTVEKIIDLKNGREFYGIQMKAVQRPMSRPIRQTAGR